NLFDGAHARRKNDRPSLGPGVPQQVVVGERRRRNLVAWRREPIDEVDRSLVPARREPRDLARAAERIDLLVVVEIELVAAFEISVRRTEWVPARLGQFLGRIDDLDGALLELHGVAPGGNRNTDQPFGLVDVAVMVDADLRDDVTGLPLPHLPVTDLD